MSRHPILRSARPAAARGLAALIAVAAIGCASPRTVVAPDTLPTEAGRFVVTLRSTQIPIPLHALHSWTLRVALPDGRPADGATVALDGGMPEHAHGLPTTPELVATGEPGTFRVDGMKFSMPGRWTLTVTAWHAGARDQATFDVVLP